MANKIVIRPVDRADYSKVVSMWQDGFFEMNPYFYDSVRSSTTTHLISITLMLVAGLVWSRVLGVVALAFVVIMYVPPIGESFFGLLLWQGILHQTRQDMTPEKLFTKWQKPGYTQFFVAEVDGTVLGCCAIAGRHTLQPAGVHHEARVPGECSVWRLSVDKTARKLGLGRKLMDACERWAIENGYRHVSLITGNPESKAFYRKIGYGAEEEDRAFAIVFGKNASVPWWRWFKAWSLRRRIHSSQTIFHKAL